MTKRRLFTGLTLIILGILVFIIGFIAMRNTDMSQYNTKRERIDSFEEYDAGGVENITLDLGVSNYSIVFSGSAEKITVDSKGVFKDLTRAEVDGNDFSYRLNDSSVINIGKINIHMFDLNFERLADIHSLSDFADIINDKADESKVTITLPDKEYKNIKINAGVGNVDISGADGDEIKLSAGVGNVTLTDISGKTTKISAGAGNIRGTDLDLGDFNLSAGVGNVDLSGKTNDTKISCGVGNVTMHIKGAKSDYNIDEDDAEIHGSGSGSGDRNYDLKISSGLGDCDIYFE